MLPSFCFMEKFAFFTVLVAKINCPFCMKNIKKFVIFSEIMLDKMGKWWYHNQARVGKLCVHCDDAGDCGLAGNFRGVCPVIGRLNCF